MGGRDKKRDRALPDKVLKGIKLSAQVTVASKKAVDKARKDAAKSRDAAMKSAMSTMSAAKASKGVKRGKGK